MDSYITGTTVRTLREAKGLTQSELADKLCVSDKAISRWETGRGLPDITLLEPLAAALDVSVIELMQGVTVVNRNTAGNMVRSKLYVCPVCGNILHSTGAAVISCCGIVLPPLESEKEDEAHAFTTQRIEDETWVTVNHPMTKTHYISFLGWLSGDSATIVKLYPEGEAQARFKLRGHGLLVMYCNRHGLYTRRI